MAHFNPRYMATDLGKIIGLCGVPEDIFKTIIAMALLQDHNRCAKCENTDTATANRSTRIKNTAQAMLNAYRVAADGTVVLYFAELDHLSRHRHQSPLYSGEVCALISDAGSYFKDVMCSGGSNLRGWFHLLNPSKRNGCDGVILPTGDGQWLRNTFKMLSASRTAIFILQNQKIVQNLNSEAATFNQEDVPLYMNRDEIKKRLETAKKTREYRKLREEKKAQIKNKFAK